MVCMDSHADLAVIRSLGRECKRQASMMLWHCLYLLILILAIQRQPNTDGQQNLQVT